MYWNDYGTYRRFGWNRRRAALLAFFDLPLIRRY